MRAFSRKFGVCCWLPIVFAFVAKFDQDVNAFIEVLTKWSLTGATCKIQRRRQVANSQKWSRSLTGVVSYQSF